ncbi:unnamed protein product [Pieris macdunnoughi]|uniref:Uncharacterized protein n=1 Tax=Pieris macdunnoughi TaxID=345717 RepID=A0A821UDZ6_9NEOP|nr:unnamed protein product [Pieris macdunnoughi]
MTSRIGFHRCVRHILGTGTRRYPTSISGSAVKIPRLDTPMRFQSYIQAGSASLPARKADTWPSQGNLVMYSCDEAKKAGETWKKLKCEAQDRTMEALNALCPIQRSYDIMKRYCKGKQIPKIIRMLH